MGFYDDYRKAVEKRRADAESKAVARAMYRVQEDFNRELLQQIADKTGHPTLAATCFVDISLNGDNSLNYHIYNDASVIDGIFNSNSSFHQGGGTWSVVSQHYGMSKYEFWERKANGEDGGDYGGVDAEWLADNFWDGVYWATNGWPRGSAEFLVSYDYNDVSAISIIKSYCKKYVRSNRFPQYIQEEINSMT